MTIGGGLFFSEASEEHLLILQVVIYIMRQPSSIVYLGKKSRSFGLNDLPIVT